MTGSVARILRTMVLFAVSAGVLAGCMPDGPELERQFSEGEAGFSVKGRVEHVFDPVSWQSVYSPDPCVFLMCSDGMSDFYMLRCSSVPSGIDDVVECDAEWTTYSDLKRKSDLEFKVVRADSSSGALWLWCASARIGAVVVRPV